MRVRFPLSLAGKSDYVAFATDYDNYGAIYSCQSVLFGHRRSASILSRRPTLDQMYINKVRTKLEQQGVDPHDFSIISHSDCKTLPSTSLLNGEIGPDTFSPENVVKVVKDVASAAVNGVVVVSDGIGNIYNNVVGNVTRTGGTDNRNGSGTRLEGAGQTDQDAELVTINSTPKPTNL